MVYTFFDEKSGTCVNKSGDAHTGTGINSNSED